MRIVLDTNVLISGLIWNGTPGKILAAARSRRVEIVTCIELLNELSRVLSRKKFSLKLVALGLTVQTILSDYMSLATSVSLIPLQAPVTRDPNDDIVLACALTAQADAIISGDKDLLVMHQYQTVPIWTPKEALNRISP
ncbi:MAG: putative toxin-antitoxin system toxin component, PIN family [Pseudomonadota bacterium]